ncbi:MAG: ScyD/ScyE family protein [Chloroflexi bacterium]|nr:ScyD/ScyE family protein [Chloroflexota bacterium]
MILRRITVGLAALAVGAAFAAPVLAQDSSLDVVADGLANPRNMSFDGEGNLYVAESGLAGSQLSPDDTAYGASGQVTRIAPDGTQEVVVAGLISYRAGDTLGVSDVVATDESLWLLLGETRDFRIPFTHALVELDIETNRVKTFVDLLTLELTEDPDANPNQQSNATDMEVLADGTVIIANAGCNCLMSWSPEAGLAVAAVWPFESDNPVPTAVDSDAEGNIYVGFLTGFPFPEGGSRIEKWNNGQLVETYSGLTAVTGLLVTADGTLYASEYGVFAPGQGWGPGRVVTVSSEGITPVLEGLNRPFGLAQNADGEIFVAVGSSGTEAAGMIVRVPGM